MNKSMLALNFLEINQSSHITVRKIYAEIMLYISS